MLLALGAGCAACFYEDHAPFVWWNDGGLLGAWSALSSLPQPFTLPSRELAARLLGVPVSAVAPGAVIGRLSCQESNLAPLQFLGISATAELWALLYQCLERDYMYPPLAPLYRAIESALDMEYPDWRARWPKRNPNAKG